jgi:rhodanese-related sulfurtransferase
MKYKKIVHLFILTLLIAGISSCESQTSSIEKETTTTNKKDTSKMKATNEIIVDVRTPEEWEFDGHAKCSVNYPLDELMDKVNELKKYDHIILVCRSGNRAGIAQRQLESAGLTHIENKGAWQNINCN